MPEDRSLVAVLARLRDGDQDAATRLFDRFARRLTALARAQLGTRLQQREGAEDVLQSVYKSFFLRQAQGEVKADTWDSLWAYLVVLTVRKCGRRVRHHRRDRRDVRAEVPLPAAADGSEAGLQVPDRDPNPAEAAALEDLVGHLLGQMAERDRPILVLRLQGYSVEEISAEVRLSERTVHRVLAETRRRARGLLEDEADESLSSGDHRHPP